MKKLLLLLVVPLLVIGCSSDKDEEFDYEWEIANDTYEFDKIEFYLGEGDGVLEWDNTKHIEEVVNNTSSDVNYAFSFSETLNNTSAFYDYSYTPYNFKEDENTVIQLPDIQDGKLVLSEKEGIFMLNGMEHFPSPNEDSMELTVPPYSTVSVVDNYTYRLLNVSYKATFIGEKTENVVDVTGKWQGMFVEYKGMSVTENSLSEE